jgi:hypothetical protein
MRMSPLDWMASADTPSPKAIVVTPPAPSVLSRVRRRQPRDPDLIAAAVPYVAHAASSGDDEIAAGFERYRLDRADSLAAYAGIAEVRVAEARDRHPGRQGLEHDLGLSLLSFTVTPWPTAYVPSG